MNITIKDTGSAKNEAETIIGCYNKIDSCVGTMSYLRKQLPNMWNGEQADIADILTKLDSSITYYETKIMPALEKLGSSILAYATATEVLANKGKNMSPSEYVASQIVSNAFDEERYVALGAGNALYDGSYSKEDFLTMVNNFGDTLGYNTISGCAVPVKEGYTTNMLPYAEDFYNEATSRGLDPAFVFSIACEESGYGSSWNVVNKGNLFGMGAFDSNPSNAFTYDSIQSGIADVCDNIANNYIAPGGKFYTGSEISSIGKTYASNPSWASNVTWIMKSIKSKN